MTTDQAIQLANELTPADNFGQAIRALTEEVVRLRESEARLKSSVQCAHGLLAPLGNQVTPSVIAIREALWILRVV